MSSQPSERELLDSMDDVRDQVFRDVQKALLDWVDLQKRAGTLPHGYGFGAGEALILLGAHFLLATMRAPERPDNLDAAFECIERYRAQGKQLIKQRRESRQDNGQ